MSNSIQLSNFLDTVTPKFPILAKELFISSYDDSIPIDEYLASVKRYYFDYISVPRTKPADENRWVNSIAKILKRQKPTPSISNNTNERLTILEQQVKDVNKILKQLIEFNSHNIQHAGLNTTEEKKVIDVVHGSDIVVAKAKKYEQVISQMWSTHIDMYPLFKPTETVTNLFRYFNNKLISAELDTTNVSLLFKVLFNLINKCILKNVFLEKVASMYNEFKIGINFQDDDDSHNLTSVDEDGFILNLPNLKRRYNITNVRNVSLTDGVRNLISILIHDIFHILHYLQEKTYGNDDTNQFVEWKNLFILNVPCE